MGSVFLIALAGSAIWLGAPDLITALKPDAASPSAQVDAGPLGPPIRQVSDAERIVELQRSIEKSTSDLKSYQEQLNSPDSSFSKADAWFRKVNADMEQRKGALKEAQASGNASEIAARQVPVKELETKWQRAREFFDLEIKKRKTLTESIAALAAKIMQDQAELDQLTNAAPAQPPTVAGPAPGAAPAAAPVPKTAKTAPPAESAAAAALSAANPLAAKAADGAAEPKEKPARPSKELVQAERDVQAKEAKAQEAQNRVETITGRLETIRDNIRLQKKLLDDARQESDTFHQALTSIESDLRKMEQQHRPEAELAAQREKIERVKKRIADNQADILKTTDRLHSLQEDLSTVQGAQIAALKEAEARKKEAEAAEKKVARLENPFQPHNLLKWALHHGPKLLGILLGMFVLRRLAWTFSLRVIQVMARSEQGKRGSKQDRENRAETLVGVFRNTVSLFIMSGGLLMILDEVNVPIVPLMGGAAVIGLAVAFGAQNLIKDYFSGFMVLMEDQYGINDVVKINDISGSVERISLRMTVLRDLEGIVHFIPHGTINSVSNMTHGWSRALFDVGVAYKEDLDRVMSVLMELGHQMRTDPTHGPNILEDPEMLGVDSFADSSISIKFFVKTRPLHQWAIKREMLRRIKIRFDELGIEIPFPHQIVYHRYENNSLPAEEPHTNTGPKRVA